MTTEEKQAFIDLQTTAIEAEIWKLDTLAAALVKAGLKDRAEAIVKQSAEQSQFLKALKETIIE